MKDRKIYVPGVPVEVSVIVSDAAKSTGAQSMAHPVVLAIQFRGAVVVLFVGEEPTARAMSIEQARNFQKQIRAVHQAIGDDVKIERMEKDFLEREPDGQ